MAPLAAVPALLAVAGIVQTLAGAACVRRFRATPRPANTQRPPITVLKPLCGDEPLLEEALASVCAQEYPAFQVVFGVQNPADPAIAVVRRLQARFPHCALDLVVDGTPHGRNRKIANLINMLPVARHDVLVIADSDVHCAPDYLDSIAAAFEVPNTGLVTTLYAGLAADPTLAGRLGTSFINHTFLPGVLLSRAMGRQDCLGATMALTRETLDAIGGLDQLADHIADDNVLGRLVRNLDLDVTLADTVPATTVPEATLGALYRHELRWARTVRALVPTAFAASSVQYPLAWAGLAAALAGGAWWSVALFGLAWAVRALAATEIDRTLQVGDAGLATPASIWLLPAREIMSAILWCAGFTGDRVEWRGQALRTDHGVSAHAPRHARLPFLPASIGTEPR